jgi:hypothetical protein
VAENDQAGSVGKILGRGEGPSEKRRHAERGEEVGAHVPRGHPLRLAIAGQVHLAIAPRRDLRQRRRAAAVVHYLSRGDPGLLERHPLAPDHHGTAGLAPGQRLEQDGIDDAEDRGVGADAEREGEDRDRGKPGVTPKRPRLEPQILDRGVEQISCRHVRLRRSGESERWGVC